MGKAEDWASDAAAAVTQPSDQYVERGFIDNEGIPSEYMNWILKRSAGNIPPNEYTHGWCVSGDIASTTTATAFTTNTPSNMDVTVGAGVVDVNGERHALDSVVLTATASHATLSRLDVVVAREGGFVLLTGLAAAFPTYTTAQQEALDGDSSDLVIAELWIPAASSSITAGADLRYLKPWRATSATSLHYYATISFILEIPGGAGNSMADLTIQLVDRDGNPLSLAAPVKVELFLQDDGSSSTVAAETITLKSGGTDITAGTGSTIAWVNTGSNGEVTLTADYGAAIAGTEDRIFQVTPLQKHSLLLPLSAGGVTLPEGYQYVAGGAVMSTFTYS